MSENADNISSLLMLKKIVRNMRGSKLSRSLGINVLEGERNLPLLYSEFCEMVPVQSALGYTNYLRAIAGKPKLNPYELFTEKGLLTSSAPDVAVNSGEDSAFPLSKEGLIKSFHIEDLLFSGKMTGIPKIKGKLFHVFESPEEFLIGSEHTIAAGEFRALRMRFMRGKYKNKCLPKLSDMRNVGKSKYQRIHAFLDALEQVGDKVEVLMARPQVVNDIALFLAQREGKVMPFKDLCPNLKVFLHYDERIAPYRKNLDDFFVGLDISYLKMMLHPSGLMALQHNVSKKGSMDVFDAMGTFYEFVPEEDIRADGTLMRYYRRYHAGQITAGKGYLVVVSNTSGLLGYNTGLIFTVDSVDPLRMTFKRMSETLNAYDERISLDVLEDLIFSANQNLETHSFNIREYMIGDDVDENKSYWVFEISRPLDGIQDQYLQSVANQLHNDMMMKNKNYRQAIQSGRMNVPEITFLPIGSISDVDMRSVIDHMDFSEDAERVVRILKRARQKRTFIPGM